MKLAECSKKKGRKQWKKEKLLVMSNFSFSHRAFKRLVLQICKKQGLFGKELLHHSDLFQLHHIANSKVTDCWRLDKVCKGLLFNFPSPDCSFSCFNLFAGSQKCEPAVAMG